MQGSYRKYQTRHGDRWSYTISLPPDPITGKRRQRQRRGFKTRKEAVAAAQAHLVARRQGDYIEPSTESLAVYLHRWLEETAQNREPSTHIAYRAHVARISTHLGQIALGDLNALHVARAYREMLADAAPTTIRTTHAILHAALAQAVKWRLLAHNPSTGVDLPRVPEEETPIWTEAEARQFLAAVAGDPLEPLWRLYLDTGCRVSEALALAWKDTDLEHGAIWLHRTLARDELGRTSIKEGCKHGSNRRVDLLPSTIASLRRHRERQVVPIRATERLVFCRPGGRFLYQGTVRVAFQRACTTAGVPIIELKGLRHTSATLQVANGVPLHTVKSRLGHSTIRLTADLYAHSTRAADREAVAILSRVLEG